MQNSLDYLAGFFDGEGCVYLRPDFQLVVSVGNVSREVVERFQQAFGGSVTERKTQGNRQRFFMWQAWGDGAGKALLAMSDRLLVKQRQCELGLEARATTRVRGGRALSEEEKAERTRIRTELTLANKRGQ